MKVEIKKLKKDGSLETVFIITFHTNPHAFDSDYERSKFFKELHGWQQSINRNERRYVYHRNGLLDEVPHVKIADSVFMAGMEHLERVENFFDEWQKKVEFDIMEMMVQKNELEKMMKRKLTSNL